MANKNKTAEKKAAEKKTTEKKKKVSPTPKVEEKAPIVEETNEQTQKGSIMMMPNSDNFRGMSQDSKVTYADLLQRRYIEHPVEGSNYTPEFLNGINSLIDATVLSVAIDEAVCGSGSLAFIIKKNPTVYLGLTNLAKSMGIENLPQFAALPSPTKEQLVSAGMENAEAEELAVVTVTDKNITKETKKAAKEEHIVANKDIELDGNKIQDENGLIEALKHRLSQKNASYRTLPDLVYLTLKPFRLANAASKEEKEKYESYNLYDWLMDAFSLVSPTILYKGIGKGMVNVTKFSGTPIRAFCIGRASTMDRKQVEEGHPNPGMKDEETAQMVKAIVNWICSTDMRCIEAELETEDVKTNEKLVEKKKAEIEDLKGVLEVINNPSFDLIETISGDNTEKIAHSVYGDILGSYFGTPYRAENENTPLNKKYKNIDYLVQQIAGSIVNLFVSSTEQNEKYSFANIDQKLIEYTQEEIVANNKAELEKKSKKG